MTLRGAPYWMRRAVDEHCVLLRKRCDKAAAQCFFERVLRTGQDRHRSGTRKNEHVFVRTAAHMNNGAENSHQPKRKLKRRMRGFRLPGRTQVFLPCFAPIRQHFAFSRHLLRASRHRKQLRDAIRNPAPFHRYYPESVRRRLHGSFNSVALSCQRQRGKAHRTPPSQTKNKAGPKPASSCPLEQQHAPVTSCKPKRASPPQSPPARSPATTGCCSSAG